MKLSVSIEGMCGLTWPKWKLLTTEVESMGFAGLFRSDHFTLMFPPDLDSLELIVSLTYLASQSRTVHFGSLVSPLSFRDPIMLARQAMALNDLSDGRMILGVGAGWEDREHEMFGYHLGDVTTRLNRLEEGLEIMTQLIRSDQPVTFKGHFYQLQEAHLLPRPQHPTPILVGGNGRKRTLALVARYADIWNCQAASPALFRELSSHLDDLIHKTKRQISDVKRTITLPVICWNDGEQLESIANAYRRALPSFGPSSTKEIIEDFETYFAAITGTPDNVIERMHDYEAAGVEEMMIQYFIVDHIEGLRTIAKHILPHFVA